MKKIFLAFSVLAIGFAIAATANAATFNVTTLNDTLDANPGDAVCADTGAACSLRAAIGEANALAGPDTVILIPGTYTQTLVAPNDDVNAGGDWDITSVITITGTGEFSCALEAATTVGTATERVLNIRPGGDLTLSRAMVRNGNFTGPMTSSTSGAGIQNNGVLTLDNVIVRDNRIVGNQGFAIGAGIHNAGTALTLISTSVTGNINTRQAGGSAFGGGIASTSQSTLTFTNSVIESNTVQAAGGFGYGAGIYLEHMFTVNMTGGLISNNTGSGTAGSNGCGVRALSNLGPSVFNATGTTFRNNTGSGPGTHQGTGIQFFTVANAGATITATLDKVRVHSNTGNAEGIGINANPNGGNISLNILSSSIHNNTGGTNGGGIMITNSGPASPDSTATVNITNTTISSNTASGNGGGLGVEQPPPATAIIANLNYVTIANNTAGTGGGISHAANGTINLKNSVVGDNTGGAAPDISGGIVSGDYNHIENTAGAAITGATTNNATGDAQLGTLAFHGGTGGDNHMPATTSPVLNTIPNATNDCATTVTVDQRGVPRGPGGGCDKGSVERAISAAIGGRVTTFDGAGIRNAIVRVTGGNLPQPLTAQTGAMGYYYIPNLPADQSYTLMVSAKRFRFDIPGSIQGVYLLFDETNVNFVAELGFRAEPSEK